jgi:hypothetical protein
MIIYIGMESLISSSTQYSDELFTEWVKSLCVDDVIKILHNNYLSSQQVKHKDRVDLLPVHKGTVGEEIVYDALKHYKLSDTSKSSYSGDMQIEHGNIKMMIEVKNYKDKVPTKEVTKFYRDIETSHCDCAMFISLNSEITKKGVFEIEILDRGGKRIPCTFIACPTKDYIEQMAKVCFGLTSINIIEDMKKVEKLVHKVKSTVGRFTMIENQLCVARESLSKSIVYLSKEIMTINEYIDEILMKISSSNEYSCTHDIEEVLEAVPVKFVDNVKIILRKVASEKIEFNNKHIKFGGYEIEVLKTKVTFVTDKNLKPKSFMTYKLGKWYIPITTETMPEILSLLTMEQDIV